MKLHPYAVSNRRYRASGVCRQCWTQYDYDPFS